MIIGITGTDGAGKGTVVEYLIKEKHFTHYSARSFIVAAIERLGLPVDRNQMRITGNRLREEHGNEFVIKQALEQARKNGDEHVVIESVRAVAEAKYLQKQGGILVAVDADLPIRYKRVQDRRSESDKVTFAEFVEQDDAEKVSAKASEQSKFEVMQMSDHIFTNNGTVKELHQKVANWLQILEK